MRATICVDEAKGTPAKFEAGGIHAMLVTEGERVAAGRQLSVEL